MSLDIKADTNPLYIYFYLLLFFFRLHNGGTMTSKESNSMARRSHYVFGAPCSLCLKDGFNKGFRPKVFPYASLSGYRVILYQAAESHHR